MIAHISANKILKSAAYLAAILGENMHTSIGRWKSIAFAAIAVAISVTAGCGGSGGNGNKANSNILGTWDLGNIVTPTVNQSGGITILCPGSQDGFSCSSLQEVYFGNDGTYEAAVDNSETAVGVYNLNGNLLSVKYHYLSSPSNTYTDTYITTIVPATPSTAPILIATLSTTNSPSNTAYLGVRYTYELI